MKIAKKAKEIVPDAYDELYELMVAYGDKIPVSRVNQILTNYDLV
jgi:hypothetical protein